MVGQIIVYPVEGQTADLFTADLLMNSFTEKHINAGIAIENSTWNNYLAFHASLPGGRFDRDEDTFADLPLLTRYSMCNKLRFRNEDQIGFSAFIGLRLTDVERIGGQTNFNTNLDKGSAAVYG